MTINHLPHEEVIATERKQNYLRTTEKVYGLLWQMTRLSTLHKVYGLKSVLKYPSPTSKNIFKRDWTSFCQTLAGFYIYTRTMQCRLRRNIHKYTCTNYCWFLRMYGTQRSRNSLFLWNSTSTAIFTRYCDWRTWIKPAPSHPYITLLSTSMSWRFLWNLPRIYYLFLIYNPAFLFQKLKDLS
jgi:hypothetical protein